MNHQTSADRFLWQISAGIKVVVCLFFAFTAYIGLQVFMEGVNQPAQHVFTIEECTASYPAAVCLRDFGPLPHGSKENGHPHGDLLQESQDRADR